jgi:hypothetical protein
MCNMCKCLLSCLSFFESLQLDFVDETTDTSKPVKLPQKVSLADIFMQSRKLFDLYTADDECEPGHGLHVSSLFFRCALKRPQVFIFLVPAGFFPSGRL